MNLRLTTLASLAALLAACVSNPTPHPGQDDTPTLFDGSAGQGGVGTRSVCDDLEGTFDADGVCDLGLESSYDANATPPLSADAPRAHIVEVAVSGEPGAYTFEVTVESADEGCDSYADWWEVLTLDGQLLYRRILAHPHVDEQPFTRSGAPIPVEVGDLLVIRAHRHPEGYDGDAFVGSIEGGLVRARLPEAFATTLADEEPLPEGCE